MLLYDGLDDAFRAKFKSNFAEGYPWRICLVLDCG